MMQEVEDLITSYASWLKDNTTLREAPDNWIEITTPYLDRHNDHLQIYAKRTNGDIRLTDDGYIIQDLLRSGCNLESRKRKDLLKTVLNGFGVRMDEEALTVVASKENFALRKHNLLQAMLAINDLFYLAAPMVAGLFYEDVVAWLDGAEIRYTPYVRFAGKSGFDHTFDIVIPKSRQQPERIIQILSKPGRETAEACAFKWIDTKKARASESKAYALLNDQDHKVAQGVQDALQNYGVKPILWSGRERALAELAA